MAGPINFAVWQTQQAGATVTETENVSVSEGADIETTNLSGISLSATVATGITFTSWTCTDFPGVGDLEFPNGTTAAAVEAGLSNPTSSATNLTVPGPGRYELTATWSDSTTETLSVRVVRPLPLAALTVTHGEVVTGGSAISETLSDTNGADITAPGAYSGALVEYPSGSTVSLTHDGNGGYTGTNPTAASNGLTLIWTATVTDDYGRSSTINKAQHMAGTGGSAVTPPNPTTATAAFDGSLSNKTFGAFTDPDVRIANYLPSNVGTSGSPSWSGSGLGPYVPTVGNGEGGVLLLSALDSSGNTLATAAHAYSIAAEGPKDVVVAPADTSEHVASGTELTAVTFGAFGDTDNRIDNYLVENIQTNGATTWTGTAPGPFTASSSAGDSGVFLLHARDASNNVLATAVHAYSRAGIGVGTVVAPNPTDENVNFGVTLSTKTFGAFTDPNVLIDNYLVENVVVNGTPTWSGSGLGPYTPNVDDGESGTLILHARNASNAILATAVHAYSRDVPGAGSVVAPAPTTVSVVSGASFPNHTFAAFTDPGNLISSYSELESNTVGVTKWTGTGLGAYIASQSADGDSGTLYLRAKNVAGDVLAVALHSYSREQPVAGAVVVAPASTNENVAIGGTPASKSFGAFTDVDSRIDNYLVDHVVGDGSTTWTGSGLGPYTASGSADGDTGTLLLHARDVSNNILATAVHVYNIQSADPAGPSLSVTDRAHNNAYLVSGGASRSLTISNPDGGTLLTVVEQASDGTPVTVNNSATTTPSWTLPAATSSGDAYIVGVTSTIGTAVNSVSFTEFIAASTAGTGGIDLPTAGNTINFVNETTSGNYSDSALDNVTVGGTFSCKATKNGADSFGIVNGSGLVHSTVGITPSSHALSNVNDGAHFHILTNANSFYTDNAIVILDYKISSWSAPNADDILYLGIWNNARSDNPGGELWIRGDGDHRLATRSNSGSPTSNDPNTTPISLNSTFYVRQVWDSSGATIRHYIGNSAPDTATARSLNGGLTFVGITMGVPGSRKQGISVKGIENSNAFIRIGFERNSTNNSSLPFTGTIESVSTTELQV